MGARRCADTWYSGPEDVFEGVELPGPAHRLRGDRQRDGRSAGDDVGSGVGEAASCPRSASTMSVMVAPV